MSGRLQDKVSIITGSTSGLGAATAERFAAEGARVVVTGRNEARGEGVAESIRKAGGDACFVACNLDDEASIESLIAGAVEAYGRVDNLIMNAAATATLTGERDLNILNLDNEILESSISTNIRGLLWLFKYSLPVLVEAASPGDERSSSIVTIGTSGTRNGAPGMPVYWTTKAPVEVMTRALAREFGPQGVRVNCVSSGLVLTESEMSAMTPEFRDYVRGLNCVPWLGRPEDIASACLFLSSDEANYVTGTTVCVNGGAAF
jgi:NAD(P)-dependent dehydrogenase (short-subunit alcohol dehydrogenase family)